MFRKPFKVKSNTQLRGSERKKFRSDLLKHFSDLTEENLQELIPNKEVTAMKLYTHSGSSVMVYCVQKMPIVFEFEKVMYPTVYMLWNLPNLLYYFTTWSQVLPKIVNGADLMLPGVILKNGYNIKAYGKLEKGERLAINLTTNSAAVAVGRAALSSYDMYMAAKRGKAVNVLHFVGDELCGWGMKVEIPDLGIPEGYADVEQSEDCGESSCTTGEELSEIVTSASAEHVSDVMNELKLGESISTDVDSISEINDCSADTRNIPLSETENSEPLEEPPCVERGEKEDMDDLVKYCFLKALKGMAKKVEYPMLSSKFYKLHMLPSCPPGKSLDLKKSTYKKLSVFLNKMNADGIVTVKELTKGVESIMGVNMNHDLLRRFVDSYCEDVPVPVASQQMPILNNARNAEITEMYVVTAAVLPLFSIYGFKKGASLLETNVRKYVTEYVKSKELQDSENKGMVKLDELLSSIVGTKGNIVSIVWGELFTKVLQRMSHSYQMSFCGNSPVLNKGKLEPIDIQVGKRTGNKKVTLINNLELYGINLTDFSRECQHGVAASTSISTVPGKKSAQLMVQGNQVLFVGNLLIGKYQIPKRYIRGLENAPKPKK